jgi:hypothetical protein
MFSQIIRTLSVCASSVGLIVIGVFYSTLLLAAEEVVAANELNETDKSLSFADYLFPETYFLKIGDNPLLTFAESLLVFAAVLLVVYALWSLQKPKVTTLQGAGFKLLNLNEKTSFIPLKAEVQTFEFLAKLQTSNKYRLSANLNRVTLTPHQNTFLLEDKNYKNALLINRRRSHRTILCDNDVLDVGEMILLYCNSDGPAGKIQRNERMDYQPTVSGVKPKGPVQKGTPILTPAGSQQDILLVRNMNSIGSSNFNDVVISSDEVALMHAKIYKVGQSWKILNLLNHETTTVNGRRIDQRFLQDGDEIAVGDTLFKFRISKVQTKQARRPRIETAKKSVKT